MGEWREKLAMEEKEKERERKRKSIACEDEVAFVRATTSIPTAMSRQQIFDTYKRY